MIQNQEDEEENSRGIIVEGTMSTSSAFELIQ